MVNPGVPWSTRKADIAERSPRGPGSVPVTANSTTKSAISAWLMKCLVPLMTQSPPSRRARVFIERTSEPAPGSVIARQSWRSPRTVGSRYVSTWSFSQARRILLGRATSACSAHDVHPSSRSASVTPMASRPPPPSSAGKFAAYRPAARALPRISLASSSGTASSRSTRSSCGISSRRTKSRTVATTARCSSLSPKSMASPLPPFLARRRLPCPPSARGPADAHNVPGRGRPGEHGVRLTDLQQPGVQVLGHRDHPAAGHVDVHQQLLGRGHILAGELVAHGMEQMKALRPGIEQLQRNPEPVAERRLAQMMHVRLGRVEGAARGPVRLIDTDVPEKGIGGVAYQQQITGLGHVAVVVKPVRRNGGLVERKRRIDR